MLQGSGDQQQTRRLISEINGNPVLYVYTFEAFIGFESNCTLIKIMFKNPST